MKEFLMATQAQLETVATIKYIDEDWGQLDDYSSHPPVKWPCCLIDLQGADFSNIGIDRAKQPQNRQEATGIVVFNFATVRLTNSSAKAPAGQKQAAWAIYDLIEEAHKVLQGFAPIQGSGKLIRTSMRKVNRDDGIKQIRVFYSLGMHNV